MADKVQPWQRQPGEPALWYNRFKAYLDMGKDRSINGVYALLRDGAEQGRINMAKAPATFYRMPGRWDWKPRAAAFDDWNDEQEANTERKRKAKEAAAESAARIDAQNLRREIINELMGDTRTAIGLAELDQFDVATARRRLPDLINLLGLLLKTHRLEYGEPITDIVTTTTTTSATSQTISADDMAAALNALKSKEFPTISLPILQTTTTITRQPSNDNE